MGTPLRPSAEATTTTLAGVVPHAASAVAVAAPAAEDELARVLRWGVQPDISLITASGELTVIRQ